MTPAQLTRLLTEIADKHLNIETLQTRQNDRLDFHACSVWAIESALIAAFEAGKASTKK